MPSTTALLVGGAAALVLAAAPPARAADAVYGGTTRAGEPIVINADADAKSLTSAVIGWHAKCGDAGYVPGATELTPMLPTPGFTPGYRDLLMSRNGKGRFAGTQLGGGSTAAIRSAMVVDLAGKLTPKKASGTLHAVVKITDLATGNAVATCDTGTLQWSASRAPGAIFGGRTSQEKPVVVRVDAKRKEVTDVLASWDTHTCTPDASYGFPEHFSGFRLKPTGRFGDAFTQDYAMDGGAKRHFAYTLAGRVTRVAAKGTLHVTMTDADAAGTQTLACDSGGVTVKALTG
jgi:hypothetical protein